jgi:hypothetical protein
VRADGIMLGEAGSPITPLLKGLHITSRIASDTLAQRDLSW